MIKKIMGFFRRMFSFSFLNGGGGKRKTETQPDILTLPVSFEETLPIEKRKIWKMKRRLSRGQIKHIRHFGWSTIVDNLIKLRA